MYNLAIAVLLLALEDLQFPGRLARSHEVQTVLASAKEFCLTENDLLKFWCGIVGVDWRVIQLAGIRVNAGILDFTKVKADLLKRNLSKALTDDDPDWL